MVKQCFGRSTHRCKLEELPEFLGNRANLRGLVGPFAGLLPYMCRPFLGCICEYFHHQSNNLLTETCITVILQYVPQNLLLLPPPRSENLARKIFYVMFWLLRYVCLTTDYDSSAVETFYIPGDVESWSGNHGSVVTMIIGQPMCPCYLNKFLESRETFCFPLLAQLNLTSVVQGLHSPMKAYSKS